MINEGKKFEQDFYKSIPKYVLVKRLNDNAASFSGGNNTRFSSNNECDYILFNDNSRTFYGLELKSTKGTLTYWSDRFETKEKKQSFNIRKCQIQGLMKWKSHNGIFGFIINFRQYDNRTFFVSIDNFINYTSLLSKKSLNINDILNMNPIEIDNKKIKKRYRYDIEDFFVKVEDVKND